MPVCLFDKVLNASRSIKDRRLAHRRSPELAAAHVTGVLLRELVTFTATLQRVTIALLRQVALPKDYISME